MNREPGQEVPGQARAARRAAGGSGGPGAGGGWVAFKVARRVLAAARGLVLAGGVQVQVQSIRKPGPVPGLMMMVAGPGALPGSSMVRVGVPYWGVRRQGM